MAGPRLEADHWWHSLTTDEKKSLRRNSVQVLQRRTDDISEVQGLIEQYGTSILTIASMSKAKQSALHHAALSGKRELLKYLLSLNHFERKSLALQDLYGNTVLHYAADASMLSLILDECGTRTLRNQIVSTMNVQGLSPLHMACEQGRTEVVRLLLPHHSNHGTCGIGHSNEKNGFTALHYAANKDVAEMLVNSLPETSMRDFVIAQNNQLETALHEACRHRRTDVVSYLLTLGIPDQDMLKAKGKPGLLPMHCAGDGSTIEVILNVLYSTGDGELVLDPGTSGQTALHYASTHGRHSVIEFIFSLPAELVDQLYDQRDNQGNTPLHFARDPRIAKLLLDQRDPTRWKQILSQKNNFNKTVIINACRTGSLDLIQYLISLEIADYDMLQERDQYGNTILHNRDIPIDVVKLLIDTLPETRRDNLFLAVNNRGMTLLHTNTLDRKDKMVKFILESEYKTQLLTKTDGEGKTPIQNCLSKKMASLYVESVDRSERLTYLCCKDDKGRTALHGATDAHVSVEVTTFLLSFPVPNNDLLFAQDNDGKTVLHLTRKCEMAQILLDSVKDNQTEKFLMIGDKKGNTALHDAVMSKRTYMVRYLCDVPATDQQHLLAKNIDRMNLIHMVENQNAFDTILKKLNRCQQKSLLCAQDSNMQYPLHSMIDKGVSVNKVIEFMEKNFHSELLEILACRDIRGDSPLFLAVKTGNTGNIRTILQFLNDLGDEQYKIDQFMARNNAKETIFHLALLHPGTVKLWETLADEGYLDLVDPDIIVFRDEHGNTLLNYLAARFETKAFADLLMRIPLQQRRRAIQNPNISGTSGRTILRQKYFNKDYYSSFVLCGNPCIQFEDSNTYKSLDNHPYEVTAHRVVKDPMVVETRYENRQFQDVIYDEDIWRVTKYGLNEYAVTTAYYFTIRTPRPTSDPMDGTSQQAVATSKFTCQEETGEQASCFLFDESEIQKRSSIYRRLRQLDLPAKHGKPKMGIRLIRKDRGTKYFLPPPGPDFIIITAYCAEHSDCGKGTSDCIHEILRQSESLNVNFTISELRKIDLIEKVMVNSTFGRQNILDEENHQYDFVTKCNDDTHVTIMNTMAKRALVVCYTHVYTAAGKREDRENWEKQYNDAVQLLHEQLGFEIEELFDPTSDTLLQNISKFSQNTSTELMAVVMMSHGDGDGNISDVNSQPVKLQLIIDALCTHQNHHVPKLLFASFCRGTLGVNVNRTKESWECTVLPDILETSDFAPIRKPFNEAARTKEWKGHPFPDVEIPTNCYVMYSTMPDSKSPREQCCFKVMTEYLNQFIITYSSGESDQELVPQPDVSGGARPKTNRKLARNEKTTSKPPKPCLDILDMLVDVSGLVRERSRFTQYINHCYTVDKGSKGLLIELG